MMPQVSFSVPAHLALALALPPVVIHLLTKLLFAVFDLKGEAKMFICHKHQEEF